MKHFSFFSLFILLAILTSACQADNTALGRVQSVVGSYQAGNGNAFEGQLTTSLRQSSARCPSNLQYGCLQLAYKNFAGQQHTASQSPQSFTFLAYEKQTDPNVRMVLVEGNWGGNPAVVSCQVFFVLLYNSNWLVDNFDIPQAMTCQQRGEELTKNLFGSPDALASPSP